MAQPHLALDVTLSEDFTGMQSVLAKLRPNWLWQDIHMKPFTAGITNKIQGYYHKTDPKWTDMILVRLYGRNTDLVIDREAELRNMKIMHLRMAGPELYAVLNNGLVYGFVTGTPTDVKVIREPAVRQLVAVQMAKLHSIDLSLHPDVDTSKPMLFDKVDGFLQVIPEQLSDPVKQQDWDKLGKSFAEIRSEVEWMKQLTAACKDLPCGFTHNDLLLENIIYNEEKGTVSFIDYEYGGYNYLYFDIGNHFAEHAGVDEIDHKLYPDRAYAKQWLAIYLSQCHKMSGNCSDVSDDELEKLCDLVNLFCLWSHLLWGVWAVVQAENSTVPFDYVQFGKSRLEGYFLWKDEFTKPFADKPN